MSRASSSDSPLTLVPTGTSVPSGASVPSGTLVLADGSVFHGTGFGHTGMTVGEICFNTAMTGYQEILTDLSYHRQIIVFTAPHIGNTGINPHDNESDKSAACGVAACGAIQRCLPTLPSNWRSQHTYPEWLSQRGIVGLAGIDTRALTLHIREKGMQGAAILHQPNAASDTSALLEAARAFPGLAGTELAMQVTTNTSAPVSQPGQKTTGKHIVIVDFGVKQSILNHLSQQGFSLSLAPADTNAETLLKLEPDGVVLSNGPGDPAATARYAAPMVRALLAANMPILAICLGHQILALSLGGKTQKMRQGHHGANHPVKNLHTGAIEICSMNHGFTVNADSLPDGIEQTHVSLFDGSNCGLAIKDKPVLSVQHHPEAGPGPSDASNIFSRFAQIIAEATS